MGFLDLFRPKWKHSDPAVRVQAARDAGEDDATILAQLVHDSDAQVRRIALRKIADPKLLKEIASSDPDEALRKTAEQKANELLLELARGGEDEAKALQAIAFIGADRELAEVVRRAPFAAVRAAAFGKITDQKALFDVARNAGDADLRKRAVEALREPAHLREIAQNASNKELGLLALAQLNDAKALEQVAKLAKNKAVKAAAQKRVGGDAAVVTPPSKSDRLQSKRDKARRVQLTRIVEMSLGSHDLDKAKLDIASAHAAWAELGSAPAGDAYVKRFGDAVTRFEKRLIEIEARAHAEQKALAERAKRANETPVVEEAPPVLEAVPVAESAAAKEAREATERLAKAERDQREELKRRKDDEVAAKKAEQLANEQKAHERLKEMEQTLTSLLESDDKKRIQQVVKIVQTAIAEAPKAATELKGRVDALRLQVVARLRDLNEVEDWKRWSNVSKLEVLCQKMEGLLEVVHRGGADLKAAAELLKTLQNEWRSVGPATKEKSEELWQRFKLSADEVYTACRTFLDEERTANLKMKTELCEKAESIAADPKSSAQAVKQLQEEWRVIGPVPKEQSDPLWQRFRAACDAIFNRRKAEFAEADAGRQANLARYQALCGEAEKLAGSTDFRAAAEQLKALQAEWKTIGPAPKAQSQEVWKRFRGACDAFFARRKEFMAQLDGERADNLKKKETLCEKAEWALAAAAADPSGSQNEAKQLMKEWKAIGPVPREQADAVWARFREACDQIFGQEKENEEELTEMQTHDAGWFDNRLPLDALMKAQAELEAQHNVQEHDAAPAATTLADDDDDNENTTLSSNTHDAPPNAHEADTLPRDKIEN